MRRSSVFRAAGACVALLLAGPTAPANATTRRTVSGWLPYWSTSTYLEHFTANADLFRTISPFWYRADSATSIYAHPGAGSSLVMDAARSKGVPVVPTLTETMNASAMAAILGSSTQRAAHENAIVNLVMSHGYGGIDIDYEQFVVTTDQKVAATNKAGFSAFTRGLCGKLRSRGKRCVITVNARVDDAMQASYRPTHAVGVFDYAVIAPASTTMRIMTYGQHYPSGARGPVAGWTWFNDVARYAFYRVGAYYRNRVEMGIAQVGYDWGQPGVRAQTYTYAQAVAKRQAVGSPRIWSTTERAPYFQYRDGNGYAHQVWYDDAASAEVRAAQALRYGFGGIALWYPGIEDGAVWPKLRAMSTT
jgi:spore germination protein YaaH